MAFGKLGRGVIMLAAALSICSAATAATISPAYDDGTAASPMRSHYASFVVLTSSSDYLPGWVLPSVVEAAVPRTIPGFRPYAKRERASLNAVRPTSVAGWRSGRVRHLASG
jgi:hypothetical protein